MIEVRPATRVPAVALPAITWPGLPTIGLPAHVAVLLGLSTGAYALSLAFVSGLQASSEAALAAERAPALATIDAVDHAYARLEADLQAARSAYEASAAAYAATGTGFADVEARLADLAKAVAAINGTAASMPASVRLPSVSRSVSGTAAPVVHATTAASGKP
jgi:hypothetical protein